MRKPTVLCVPLVSILAMLNAASTHAQTNPTKRTIPQAASSMTKSATAGNAKSGRASGSPSLVETLDFISHALAPDGGGGRSDRGRNGWTADYSFRTSLSSNGSCTVTFVETIDSTVTRANARSEGTQTHSYTVDLRDIDPSSVKSRASEAGSGQYATWSATGFIVGIATSNLSNTITHTFKGSGTSHDKDEKATPYNTDPKQDVVNKLEIHVSDGNIAVRVANALTHAVSLCGGQRSAF